MVIILMGLIVFAAILIVGYPLVNDKGYELAGTGVEGDANYEHLASARNSVFEAIRDLEFDRAIGKLSDSDYATMRARYDAKAAEVLQKMDALGSAKAKRSSAAPETPGKGTGKPSAARQGAKKNYCNHCGARVEASDRFCAACGKRLN